MAPAPTAPPRPAGTPAPICGGCGGNKFDAQAFNRPGGADELIQQMG